MASFISFQVIATNWLAAFVRHYQKSPFWRHSHGFAESITFRYDAPLVHGFADFLIARLSYDPTVALLVIGLLCTVALEIHERVRRREP
ncbi:hypothetical protein [Halomicrobium urmianum]|uniref:hypothetical protein n=1 Tax=Halomicrobium urmianum TaxID=1586233 RepID=UPI001CD9AC35|nr:hypothetical protein [Halomicrobium urmianum]